MKQISPQLATHLRGPVTTLATCWEILRRDGVAFRFTDHDRDIAVEGAIYRARFGYARTALASDAALSVDNVDVDPAQRIRADRHGADHVWHRQKRRRGAGRAGVSPCRRHGGGRQ